MFLSRPLSFGLGLAANEETPAEAEGGGPKFCALAAEIGSDVPANSFR